MKKSMLIMVAVLLVLFGVAVAKITFSDGEVNEYTKRDTKMVERFVKSQDYYESGDKVVIDESKEDLVNFVIYSKNGELKVNKVISKTAIREANEL